MHDVYERHKENLARKQQDMEDQKDDKNDDDDKEL